MNKLILGLVVFFGVHAISLLALGWRDRMLCYKDMLAWFWRYRGRLRRDIQDVAFYLLRRVFPSTASRTRAATGGHSA